MRYTEGCGSVDRRDLSLRAVSVPVVLPARWGVGSKKLRNPWAGVSDRRNAITFPFYGVGVARIGCGALVQYEPEQFLIRIRIRFVAWAV